MFRSCVMSPSIPKQKITLQEWKNLFKTGQICSRKDSQLRNHSSLSSRSVIRLHLRQPVVTKGNICYCINSNNWNGDLNKNFSTSCITCSPTSGPNEERHRKKNIIFGVFVGTFVGTVFYLKMTLPEHEDYVIIQPEEKKLK